MGVHEMSWSIPLNRSAVDIFTKAFENVSRVLVLGGTGWFGRTALGMLANMDVKTHIVASCSREFSVNGVPLKAKNWDQLEIARFEPEIVLDFAYLTVGKAEELGIDRFIQVNRELSEKLFFAARLPSVRSVLSVSSGASVRLPLAMKGQPAAEAYARGKQNIAAQLERIAVEREISVRVARAWSVTGGHVQRPREYALSGMVLDGLEHGLISVHADYLVHRRYLAVEDLLALAVAHSHVIGLTFVDSGGPLIELRALAQLISTALPGTRVLAKKEPRRMLQDDSYFADEAVLKSQTASSELDPLDLGAQIRNVIVSLQSR